MMKLLLLLITALCLMLVAALILCLKLVAAQILCLKLVAALILCLLLLTTMLLQIYWTLPQQSDANRYAETTYQWGKHPSTYVCIEHECTWLKLVMYLYSNWSCIHFSFGNEQGCTYTTICLYCRYTTILAIILAVLIPIQIFTAGCIRMRIMYLTRSRKFEMAKLEALSRRRSAVLCLSRSQISKRSKSFQCWRTSHFLSPLSSFCWAVNRRLSYIWTRSPVVFYPLNPRPTRPQSGIISSMCQRGTETMRKLNCKPVTDRHTYIQTQPQTPLA